MRKSTDPEVKKKEAYHKVKYQGGKIYEGG
jgi:hypothetical protein